MTKTYTAQEMRDRAKACEFNGDLITAAMLQQAAVMMEREKKSVKDALIKELATSLKSYLAGDCIDCRQCAEGDEACDHHKKLGKLIADAREAANV